MADRNYPEILGRNLEELMKRSNEYKSAVAKGAGISRPLLDDLLAGSGNPTLSSLIQISDYFDVPVWKLMTEDLGESIVGGKVTAEIPSRMLERISDETRKLRDRVGNIPADVLDLLSALAATNPADPIFIAIREMAGATDVFEESDQQGKKKSDPL